MRVSKEEVDTVAELPYNWKKLKQLADTVADSLSNVQVTGAATPTTAAPTATATSSTTATATTTLTTSTLPLCRPPSRRNWCAR